MTWYHYILVGFLLGVFIEFVIVAGETGLTKGSSLNGTRRRK